jgi:hypothetical protein
MEKDSGQILAVPTENLHVFLGKLERLPRVGVQGVLYTQSRTVRVPKLNSELLVALLKMSHEKHWLRWSDKR